MSDTIIKIENLSKKYVIGKQHSGSLRETLANTFGLSKSNTEEFWALRDINLEIKQGEVVGVIGRNGAGKSTLLKLLSKITYPTTGNIMLNGRVSSLLEVGTGFHAELTGRENIYLNGTILGMNKKEIKSKFDEIVDFSGIKKFLDTPVKRYSSGMYVRLAFAVAAHLEPEILIIDEVLAVGDAEFQKKCLGKMGEVAKGGRTVIFVSHNMGAVRSLCNKGVLLNKGTLEDVGETNNIIDRYISNQDLISQDNDISKKIKKNRINFSSKDVELIDIKFEKNQNLFCQFATDEDIILKYTVKGNRKVNNFRINATLFNNENIAIGSLSCLDTHNINNGEIKTVFLKINNHNLALGNYSISTSLGVGNFINGMSDFDIIMNIINFEINKYKKNNSTDFMKWDYNWGNIVLQANSYTL